MFDFLFKKRSTVSKISGQTAPQIESKPVDAKFLDKQRALQQADSFADQEEAALAFILQSSFADARLQAVRHVHSESALLQVSQAMRNTDRRVSKLAQEKLATLHYRQKMHVAVQDCLAQGQQLLAMPQLMTNQVSAWDKVRLSLGEYASSLQQIKLDLEQRLQEQLLLQRQALQLAAQLQQLIRSDLPAQQGKEKLVECEDQLRAIQSDRLVESLPKNQLGQLELDISAAQKHLQLASEIRQPVIEAAPTASEPEIMVASELEAPVHELVHAATLIEPDIQVLLNSLEQALENGSLQQALDIDKSLRQVAIRGEWTARLQTLRSELSRLLDWAKWGGNVSREELIKVAEDLSNGQFAPPEIAKQVGGLRARWKELDRTSGVALQSMWERFDAACGKAYALADAYFKQLAQQRSENLQLAQALLIEIDTAISALAGPVTDWKAQQACINKFRLDWRKIGTIDRKLKSKLEIDFDSKMLQLNQPLLAAQELAVQMRLQIIDSVSKLNGNDRDAVEKVKQAQQRWQQQATSMLLARKQEQDLWLQFRAACDAVFTQRKASSEQHKESRQQKLTAKQACCERLEGLFDKPRAEIASTLKSTQQDWHELSAQTRGFEERFENVVAALEARHAELLVLEKQAGLINLTAKIKLCQQIESAGLTASELGESEMSVPLLAWKNEWDALAKSGAVNPNTALNKVLVQRFNAAIDHVSHRQQLSEPDRAENLQQFEERLLRLELLRGLPSPAELSQQRKQVQLKDLQSALKNRDTSESYLNNLHAICALPVPLDAQHEQRLHVVLADSAKQ
ncbi:hypothetical protein AAKU58_000021 [Oxalobacteraceae bacterium GrIS 1.18]